LEFSRETETGFLSSSYEIENRFHFQYLQADCQGLAVRELILQPDRWLAAENSTLMSGES